MKFSIYNFLYRVGLSSHRQFSNKGFTLLEGLVAVAILSIGLVAVLQVFPIGFGIELDSQRETQATMLCQEKIEELASLAYQNIAVGSTSENPLPPPFEDFSRETEVIYVDGNLQPSASDTGLKKIEVKVSWNSPLWQGKKNIILTTLIAQK